MIFWILWIIGIIITIITKCSLNKSMKKNNGRNKKCISELEQKTKIRLYLLVVVCIILVGGIAVAKFVGLFYEIPFWGQILIGIIPALLTYSVGDMILSLGDFDDNRSKFFFVLVFIISILGWTILINNYNRNTEYVTKVIVESTKERKLLYFCNVPVQEITGEIEGLGGWISGSTDTTHELTYWYVNKKGKGIFDTAPANSSEIEFLEEGTPYVEILNYCKYKKRVDHNIDSEMTYEENRWTKLSILFLLLIINICLLYFLFQQTVSLKI